MIPVYAKALLGAYAKKMRDVIHEVQANETDEIVVHKLAEIAADIRHAVAMQAVDTAVVMHKVSKALAPFFANAASQTPQIFDEPALPDKPIF